MRRDPLIIGGGPAGSAAAIVLARAGHSPTLIERTIGPADKVCGDFLSMDTILRARALGVDAASMGAAAIDRIRLIHGERVAESPLPFPACGLSRRALDAALLEQAVRVGAVVRGGQTVRHLTRTGGTWTAQIADQAPLTAETVFLATGKHDLRDMPRPNADRGAIGMKMYYAPAPGPRKALEGAIELTLFPGGYAGMQQVENGHAVLCIAVQRRAFQQYGSGWPPLIAAIEQGSRRFASMLVGARALLPRPLAVAGVPYGYQAMPAAADGLFRLGDQAAVIPSLTGDGMAIALHSGVAAAESWLRGVDSADYQRTLARILAPQMRLAGLLHRACMSGPVQVAAIRAAMLFPGVLRQAAGRTRLRSGPQVAGQPVPA